MQDTRRQNRPEGLLSNQTMMTRALASGMLPHAHPDELKVLHFLVQQSEPSGNRNGYCWMTGGKYMSMAEWAVKILGISDRRQLYTALDRLQEHGLIHREGVRGARGEHPTEHRLTRYFAEAAVDWYTEVWLADGLPRLIRDGADPQAHLAERHGIAKIELPPRPKRVGPRRRVLKAI